MLGSRAVTNETFPIDLTLRPLTLDPSATSLSPAQKDALAYNVQRCRDAIVFFTALSGAKGLSGHSGGAFDTVPFFRRLFENEPY